tara:strand:+ start:90 stop:386 length:297 start_codon:yes stop_codon:yes gene_type:complete
MSEKEIKQIQPIERKEKVSENHLKELQSLVNAINGMQYQIGKLETQKHNILHEFAKGQDRIKLMQDKMVKEYGTADINVTDGTINWPEEEDKKVEDEK